MVKKLTTFIDKNIPLTRRRQGAFKSALALLTDLHAAYLYAPRAPRPYSELRGMDLFLYFDPGHCPKYQLLRRAFERSSRVEAHIVDNHYHLAFVRVAFYLHSGKKPFFEITAELNRAGGFTGVEFAECESKTRQKEPPQRSAKSYFDDDDPEMWPR